MENDFLNAGIIRMDDLFDVPEEKIFKQDNGQKSHEFPFDYAI